MGGVFSPSELEVFERIAKALEELVLDCPNVDCPGNRSRSVGAAGGAL